VTVVGGQIKKKEKRREEKRGGGSKDRPLVLLGHGSTQVVLASSLTLKIFILFPADSQAKTT